MMTIFRSPFPRKKLPIRPMLMRGRAQAFCFDESARDSRKSGMSCRQGKAGIALLPPGCLAGHPQEFLWSFRRAGEVKFMKAPFLSSPLPWIVHRGDGKGRRQAFSSL